MTSKLIIYEMISVYIVTEYIEYESTCVSCITLSCV